LREAFSQILGVGVAPRKYRLGKRAEAVARTRARIVAAAMTLYQEQPVAVTSMQEVARRADVAPGTVLNHFATPDELASAVVSELVRTLEAPSSEIFEGVEGVAARLRALGRSLARFYERAEPWFHVHEREHDQVAAFGEGARVFDERVEGLIREALGPGHEARAVSAARWLMSPPVFRGLREHEGRTVEEAADLVTEILVAWLDNPMNGRGEE
jgi:AcrR family transcriptional regulator